MQFIPTGPLPCAILTAGAAIVLWMGGRGRRVWPALLAVALLHAVILTGTPGNLLNINLAHHYLGARHAVPYGDFYRLVHAALGRPQVGMRDLEHPPRIVRADPRAERAYYLDLLADRPDVDRLAPLAALREAGQDAVRQEGDSLLRTLLPPGRAAPFQRDVRAVAARLEGRDLTDDYGYNGSPFYSLLRRLDPALYLPFGTALGVVSLVWQLAMLALVVWILGMALDLTPMERMAAATLFLASWDFTGYVLPGLVFGGVWLPVACGLLAVRRGRFALAGGAIAWAGLIKLFPFLLLLPALARPRRGWPAVVAAALAAITLSLLSVLSGRSWLEFGRKIVSEFSSAAYLVNSVSLSNGLLTLGIHDSPVPALVAAATLVTLFLLLRRETQEDRTLWPRRMLLLLSLGGYLAHTWFNYYALAPLPLLVLLSRARRGTAALLCLATALAAALPDFDQPALAAHPALHALKVLPYLAVPAWLLVLEFRAWRIYWFAGALCACLITLEAGRFAAMRGLRAEVAAALDRGDGARALAACARLQRLAPRDAMARMDEGIAHAILKEDEAAGRAFQRAVHLDPGNVDALRNLARWHVKAGRLDLAGDQLEAALALRPYDDGSLIDLARVRAEQGREEDAGGLLLRARELNPSSSRGR